MERVQVNPVIPGFAPDPSIVYVDGTYFLVNSSFHIFPGLPVYASKNLKDWKQIGNAFNRTSQLKVQQSLTKIVGEGDDIVCSQGGLYAPTIRHHNGTFYIVCTNVIHTASQPHWKNEVQNFILTTTDIWSSQWSDPIFYDFLAIDTSLFWDDDGRIYVQGAASDPYAEHCIRQFEINLETGERLSEIKTLWKGITNVYPEGPHIQKRDGWYYLMIAEGGCFTDHHVNMARSRNIWGPYEPDPANPVLGKTDPAGYIQYTGHGDLFQDDATGQWYFVCLGVRKTRDGRFIMGRESVLTTATWPEGEFPVIDVAHLEAPIATSKALLALELPSSAERRIAAAGRPDVGFVHIRDPVEANYTYHKDGGITLTPGSADVSQSEKPVTFVGKRQRLLDSSASVTLGLTDPRPQLANIKTGLCYYKDEHRFVRVYLDSTSGDVVFQLVNKAKSIERTATRLVDALIDAADITFGVDYTETEMVFWFSVNGHSEKTEIGKIDTLEMTGHDFVGPIIGIFAVGDGGGEGSKAHYTALRLDDF